MITIDSQNKSNQNESDLSIKEIILKVRELSQYLLSKWIIILIFGVFGGVVGFFYTYYKEPIYTATTTFVLESGEGNGGGLGQYAGLASMVGIDLAGGGV